MAQCDTGYFCSVCGEYVETLEESGLYLRYVLGEVAFEELFDAEDAHILCLPELASLIDDERFDHGLEPHELVGEDGRRTRERVTRAWRRLQSLRAEGIELDQYPLADEAASD